MFEIEKDVSMPKMPGGKGGPRKYPWVEMEIGDSFFVSGKTAAIFSAHAVRAGITYRRKFSCRTDGERGVRVWRTK